jgi:hypothetical protein
MIEPNKCSTWKKNEKGKQASNALIFLKNKISVSRLPE